MLSMTGYGASQTKNPKVEIEVHVKSVNARFLEIRFHLPKEYAPYENRLREAFKGWQRGAVDVYVHRRPTAHSRLQTVEIRSQNAQFWVKSLKQLVRDLKIKEDISLRDILQMPYVVEHHDRLSLFPGELKLLEGELAKAATQCLEFREREGKSLKKELLRLLADLQVQVQRMSKSRDAAMASAQQRLKNKMATLKSEELDSSRLALETALWMDKMDINEEIVRLREHVEATRALIASGESRGKKLDFFCQELLREVNTIGSKSQLAALTQIVIDAKTKIEQFREQVQNVE